MADIKNQLVKDTYNYVLQSDLSTGYVYRIGGDVPVNPIFSSGLTILENFKYSNGTEQNGYVLYSDSVGNAYWGAPPSGSGGTVSGDYLPLSGGTVTGNTIFTSGLTATTISATTYLNLPTDIRVTGGTYSNGTTTFTNNTGGTFTVTGFTNPFTGGTVSGATNFTGGVSATTISAATYQNLPLDIRVTGGTYSNGTATFTNNTGGTFSVSGFTNPFTGGTVTGSTIFTNGLSANTISATTYQNLPTDIRVTGGTLSGGVATFTNNTGGTFSVSGFLTGATFNGGIVTGDTIFTNNVTATTISATTILADNIQRTLYRLPASVACPANTTTTAFTLNIPRASVFSGQTLKVEGIITAQQTTAANKTVTCIWGTNTLTPQNANMGTTLNAGSFGFLARVTQTGVYYGRQSIYSYSNQSATAAADVGSNITVRIEVNPSTSAATVDHIVVTIY